MRHRLDAVLLDIGGTLVHEQPPATPTDELVVSLLPDVVADVTELASLVRVGAVTDTAVMTEADVRALLRPSGLDQLLEVLVTSVDAGAAKPDPTSLRLAASRLGLGDLSRVLYIGDRGVDVDAAAAAGMPFAAANGTIASVVERFLADDAGHRFERARSAVVAPDEAAAEAARQLHDRLTKPRGALGDLEPLGVRLAAMAGECPPPLPQPAAVAVFAGDHGVVAEGVTPWPQEVTAQMVANFVAGGAAVNVLARQVGASVAVVDVGVAGETAGALPRKVRSGTANLAAGPAMTVTEAKQALDVGVEVAEGVIAAGARCLLTGDMGIGNTTPSAALIATITGRPAEEVTGRGTGVDDETLHLKTQLVAAAAARSAGLAPLELLAEVGGLEIAALAGFITGGAAARVPVIVDGVIALAGAMAAEALCPGAKAWCVAGHRSVEPGATAALHHLGLVPLIDLRLRLGEGTGAALALPLVQAAARVLREMATFDSAGVADKA